MKGLLWLALAFLLGVVIGWLLRSLTSRREVAEARAAGPDEADMKRLQARIAELEPLVEDKARLIAELEACRSGKQLNPEYVAATTGQVPVITRDTPPPAEVDETAESDEVADPVRNTDQPDISDSTDGPATVAGFAGLADDSADLATDSADLATEPDNTDTGTNANTADAAELDLAAAAEVLGRKIVLDDLRVVEGIGPKIAGLCNGIGIHTWAELAETEVSLLRTMLDDAGHRFKTHDPGTWPQQAELLAAGQWETFKTLTDELDGGRPI